MVSGIEAEPRMSERYQAEPGNAFAGPAFDDAETRERARKLGAVAFFRKPVDGQALIDAIHWATGGTKHNPTLTDS